MIKPDHDFRRDISEGLSRLSVERKSGKEPFHHAGQPLGFDLLGFWQWSASDLANNTARGVVAEYLVARALDAAGGCRTEWDAFDVLDVGTERSIKVEVKSSAYLQSWHQSQESSPSFGIAATRGWDASTNTYSETSERQADVYVFALLAHRHKPTLDPLDVSQWAFYVVSTGTLNKEFPIQRRVSLGSLERIGCLPCGYNRLAEKIRASAPAGQKPT
jgi:hypothetical protein